LRGDVRPTGKDVKLEKEALKGVFGKMDVVADTLPELAKKVALR
jgi:hypothetical protein